ncbi:hypothetical protein HS7_03410 [Sulfolobales archaeon HS-7]|nr:hypothetical protein HS7_03410 [Sulfolobales archaeon HS-7]
MMNVIELLESSEPIDALKKEIPGLQVMEKGEVSFIKYKYGDGKPIEILGRLGAVQMKGEYGLVSDADGAIVALTVLLELLNLKRKGISIPGSVVISTSISLDAGLIEHKPFKFMVPKIGLEDALPIEVERDAELVISVDSTKGNNLVKFDDFALTHVVFGGYLLRLRDEVIELYKRVTGHEIYMLALTTGDLTPMEFKVNHVSTLVTPWLYTNSPLIGLATVSKQVIPGYVTGVQDFLMLERSARFCLEMIKYVGKGGKVYYEEELSELLSKLGDNELAKLRRERGIP